MKIVLNQELITKSILKAKPATIHVKIVPGILSLLLLKKKFFSVSHLEVRICDKVKPWSWEIIQLFYWSEFSIYANSGCFCLSCCVPLWHGLFEFVFKNFRSICMLFFPQCHKFLKLNKFKILHGLFNLSNSRSNQWENWCYLMTGPVFLLDLDYFVVVFFCFCF